MNAAGPRLSVGQHSEAGVGKPVNQDFHGAVLPAGAALQAKGAAVALADGIGSSDVGHVASATAVRGFLDDYYATSAAWTVRRAAQCVLGATNAWLHAQTQRGAGRFDRDRGCVCAFSALVFKGREVHLLHVGDTRVCRLHPAALEALSDDHRVHVADDEGGGMRLARALGVAAHVEVDHATWPAEAGEVYLLATDGAWEHLDAAAVHAALAAHPHDLDAAARALVAAARGRGGRDDATVQLVRVEALPEPPAHRLHAEREGLAVPPPLRPGMAFEGYEIVRELHVGPRSHVHLAVDAASGRRVALKVPSAETAGDAAALDRLVLEEWVARRVDSPHVVRAAGAERARRHVFVALEHVEGRTLAQWIVDHPRPPLDAVRQLVAQLAAGVQALHRRQMLHRDLRPDNAIVDDRGTVRLIDFGAVHVAGLAEGFGGPARPTGVEGELQYAAPEVLLGHGASEASDLFALAVVTYRLLGGDLPYGLDAVRLRGPRDVARLAYRPLRVRRPDLPPWIDAVLRKALHPRPERRQQALSEFVEDLRAPGPEFTGGRAVPLVERHPVAFWQALCLLLALAVVVLVGLRVAGR